MSEKIKKIRFFNVFEYDLEEEYLREMHQKGYAYLNLSMIGVYEFNKTEPEDMIYKLDYPGNFRNQQDRDDYLQMFKDSGWEYLGQKYQYTYFRRKAIDGIELDIFSDNETRKQNLKGIFKDRFLPVLIIFFVV